MLVTFGESLLRFSTQNFKMIDQSNAVDFFLGGAELNVAASLASLGTPSKYISILPDNEMGEFAIKKLRSHEVDVSSIQFRDGPMGWYFLENGASPRPSRVLVRQKSLLSEVLERHHFGENSQRTTSKNTLKSEEYRDGAQDLQSLLQSSEINTENFSSFFDWKKIFKGANGFHLSGITPSLGSGSFIESLCALNEAKRQGIEISYDVNFRKNVSSLELAKLVHSKIISFVDTLFGSESDLEAFFDIELPKSNSGRFSALESGVSSEELNRLQVIQDKVFEKMTFKKMLLSSRGKNLQSQDFYQVTGFARDEIHSSPKIEVEFNDRIGAGDAMTAGFWWSYFQDQSLKVLVESAAAYGAVKHSLHGDFATLSSNQLSDFMKTSSWSLQR